MASLVFYVISLGDELLRICQLFVRSGYSIHDCIEYLVLERREILTKNYLNEIFGDTKTTRLTNSFQQIDFPKNIERNIEAATMVNPEVVATKDVQNVVPGTSFYIHGNILRTCERFSINLVLNTPQEDIALHFNPRLPQNYIVRNSKINGSWGVEEVTSALKFSLHRGHQFSVQILVTESDYYISINGKHFASFRHRLPYERLIRLVVKGDVTDVKLEQNNVVDYPDFMNSKPGNVAIYDHVIVNPLAELDEHRKYLPMPYYGELKRIFSNGYRIQITGRVKLLPHSFYINLQQGSKIWPHPLIPFHLNPRFANIGGKHVICRNSWQNGEWDREERTEIHMDFMPGKEFSLTINCCDSSYNVYLNDKFIAEFQFRMNENLVDTIYIQGDIHLYNVTLEKYLATDEAFELFENDNEILIQ